MTGSEVSCCQAWPEVACSRVSESHTVLALALWWCHWHSSACPLLHCLFLPFPWSTYTLLQHWVSSIPPALRPRLQSPWADFLSTHSQVRIYFSQTLYNAQDLTGPYVLILPFTKPLFFKDVSMLITSTYFLIIPTLEEISISAPIVPEFFQESKPVPSQSHWPPLLLTQANLCSIYHPLAWPSSFPKVFIIWLNYHQFANDFSGHIVSPHLSTLISSCGLGFSIWLWTTCSK